jgi:nucleoside deoxyribosyltransferase
MGISTIAATRLDHVPPTLGTAGAVCRKEYLVEDFGMSVNLMLSCSNTLVVGGTQECLAAMRASRA